MWQNSAAMKNATVEGEGVASNVSKDSPCWLFGAARWCAQHHRRDGVCELLGTRSAELKVGSGGALGFVEARGSIVTSIGAKEG